MVSRFFNFSKTGDLKVLVILPANHCNSSSSGFVLNKIVNPSGISIDDFAFYSAYTEKGKNLKKAEIIEIIKDVAEYCATMGIETVLCGMAPVFKYMVPTKTKFTENFGRVIPSVGLELKKEVILEENALNIVPMLDPVILNTYPHKAVEVAKALSCAKSLVMGSYSEPAETKDKIKISKCIMDFEEGREILSRIKHRDRLFLDIETTGLRWYKDKLLTISIAVSSEEAYCFPLHEMYYEDKVMCSSMRNLIRSFLAVYKGSQVGHNWIGFDLPFVIHELHRKGDFSIPYLPFVNAPKLDDTMLMAYLLFNSTERASIGLKNLSYKWLGDYDKDIDQSRLEVAPLEKVAEYNNLDVIATALVYEELWKRIVEEGFEDVYNKFVKIGRQLLKVKMEGLRVDIDRTKDLSDELKWLIAEEERNMLLAIDVIRTEDYMAEVRLNKYNETHKLQKTDVEEFKEKFNPASPKQKQVLFFDIMGLPEITVSKTTRLPSTGAETITAWLQDTSISEEAKILITTIRDFQLANKIRTTYLKNIISGAVEVAAGDFRMFANFNQTATITGRLSSSGDINLQTIPSSSKYGKKVKELFIAPEGFILASADFSALEERLMANESMDENKLAVFTEGIDGHCLNAYAYFKDEMPDITEELAIIEGKVTGKTTVYKNRVEVINSIKKRYPHLRQDSKPITFSFNYGAGEEKNGKAVYDAYWDTYFATKKYNEGVIKKAAKDGYLISKFSGVRLWLPSITAPSKFVKAKEERVATNFVIQSGNFLTLEALSDLQDWIESEGYYQHIKIINTVHDSIVLICANKISIVQKLNEQLIQIMTKDYEKDQSIKLEAELELGNSYAEALGLPNNADEEEVQRVLLELG